MELMKRLLRCIPFLEMHRGFLFQSDYGGNDTAWNSQLPSPGTMARGENAWLEQALKEQGKWHLY
jgi:hypothetical protein